MSLSFGPEEAEQLIYFYAVGATKQCPLALRGKLRGSVISHHLRRRPHARPYLGFALFFNQDFYTYPHFLYLSPSQVQYEFWDLISLNFETEAHEYIKKPTEGL